MTLYPLSLFYLLLPMPWSFGVFSLGHLLLGGRDVLPCAPLDGHAWGRPLPERPLPSTA